MDQDYAHLCQIPHQELMDNRHVEVIDRIPIDSRDIAESAKVGMIFQDHKEQLQMVVTKLGYHHIVLEFLGYGYMKVQFGLPLITLCLDHKPV